MRFQLKEAAWLESQRFEAGTIFGDPPSDHPLPTGWSTSPPPFVIGLDAPAQAALRSANAALVATLRRQNVIGSVAGIGHPSNLS
jgi:hypothetical protein